MGSLSRGYGVSVPGGLCPRGSLSKGVSVQGGLCPEGGVSVQGGSVQECIPVGCVPSALYCITIWGVSVHGVLGLCPWGVWSLSQGVSV